MSTHYINFIAIIFHSLPLQVFIRERTPARTPVLSQYKRVSCVARGRKGQRVTVTGVSAALRLVSTLVSTVAWPFQCALIEPFLFVAQCQAAGFRAARRGRGRLVHCWVNHLASLPRLLGGLLGILGILSRKAIGGGGTQVTSCRHTVLEPGVG